MNEVGIFSSLTKYNFYPFCLTFKGEDDIMGIIENLKKGFLAQTLGVDPQKVWHYIDEGRKDFAVVYAITKQENKALVIILLDETNLSNGQYFKNLRDNWQKIIIPVSDVGTRSNPLDIIGKKITQSWDEIEAELMKNNKWKHGIQLANKRRLEINIISSLAADDVPDIIEDMGNPSDLTKQKMQLMGFEKKFIMYTQEVPLGILINEYKADNTIQIVILLERDRFGHNATKIFNGKKDNNKVYIPIKDMGLMVNRRDIQESINNVKKITYQEN